MGSTFIDQSVVTGSSGTTNVPIPGAATASDLIVATGYATGTTGDNFYQFPLGWHEVVNGIFLPGDGSSTQTFIVSKLLAAETDLTLTASGAGLTLHQCVLQVWRGAALLFLGPATEYTSTDGRDTPLPNTSGSALTADPTAIIGGNIAFSVCVTPGVISISSADAASKGFIESTLQSQVGIYYRGFTQGEGGSSYPTPVFDFAPDSEYVVTSFGFSGAPEPVSAAAWELPPLGWAAEGAVEPFNPTGGVMTKRFDAGTGSEWYICSSVVDSGVELLAKTIKGMRAIGKLTNASMMLFSYDIGDGIDVGDLETGTNSSTGSVALTDSTQVAQSAMLNTNVTNSVLWAARIEGDDTGEATRDRVDELVVQVAEGGVRR
jgi:hypothetical protein